MPSGPCNLFTPSGMISLLFPTQLCSFTASTHSCAHWTHVISLSLERNYVALSFPFLPFIFIWQMPNWPVCLALLHAHQINAYCSKYKKNQFFDLSQNLWCIIDENCVFIFRGSSSLLRERESYAATRRSFILRRDISSLIWRDTSQLLNPWFWR